MQPIDRISHNINGLELTDCRTTYINVLFFFLFIFFFIDGSGAVAVLGQT